MENNNNASTNNFNYLTDSLNLNNDNDPLVDPASTFTTDFNL